MPAMSSRRGPRSFQVASPLRVKAAVLAIVVPLALFVLVASSELVQDATLRAIVPFVVVLAGAAAFLWPRRLIIGRDGAAIAGALGAYRSWDRIASVSLEHRFRRGLVITLTCHDGSMWTIEPFSDVDGAPMAQQLEARRRDFAAGQFERLEKGEESSDYRVAPIEPYLRVLEDPRRHLGDRVAAAESLASLERAHADEALDELLESTADPRARRALERV